MTSSPQTNAFGGWHGSAYCGAYGLAVLPGKQCPRAKPHGPSYDGSGTTGSGIENPAVISNQPLVNGVENAPIPADFIGSVGPRTGLFAFDTAQVQLVAIPDIHTLAPAGRDVVVRGALDYCAARGDCMYVGSAPDRGVPTALTFRRWTCQPIAVT